ncbi:MAG: hypothetical protein AAGE99_00215 [Chlamydiota bacterium]
MEMSVKQTSPMQNMSVALDRAAAEKENVIVEMHELKMICPTRAAIQNSAGLSDIDDARVADLFEKIVDHTVPFFAEIQSMGKDFFRLNAKLVEICQMITYTASEIDEYNGEIESIDDADERIGFYKDISSDVRSSLDDIATKVETLRKEILKLDEKSEGLNKGIEEYRSGVNDIDKKASTIQSECDSNLKAIQRDKTKTVVSGGIITVNGRLTGGLFGFGAVNYWNPAGWIALAGGATITGLNIAAARALDDRYESSEKNGKTEKQLFSEDKRLTTFIRSDIQRNLETVRKVSRCFSLLLEKLKEGTESLLDQLSRFDETLKKIEASGEEKERMIKTRWNAFAKNFSEIGEKAIKYLQA